MMKANDDDPFMPPLLFPKFSPSNNETNNETAAASASLSLKEHTTPITVNSSIDDDEQASSSSSNIGGDGDGLHYLPSLNNNSNITSASDADDSAERKVGRLVQRVPPPKGSIGISNTQQQLYESSSLSSSKNSNKEHQIKKAMMLTNCPSDESNDSSSKSPPTTTNNNNNNDKYNYNYNYKYIGSIANPNLFTTEDISSITQLQISTYLTVEERVTIGLKVYNAKIDGGYTASSNSSSSSSSSSSSNKKGEERGGNCDCCCDCGLPLLLMPSTASCISSSSSSSSSSGSSNDKPTEHPELREGTLDNWVNNQEQKLQAHNNTTTASAMGEESNFNSLLTDEMTELELKHRQRSLCIANHYKQQKQQHQHQQHQEKGGCCVVCPVLKKCVLKRILEGRGPATIAGGVTPTVVVPTSIADRQRQRYTHENYHFVVSPVHPSDGGSGNGILHNGNNVMMYNNTSITGTNTHTVNNNNNHVGQVVVEEGEEDTQHTNNCHFFPTFATTTKTNNNNNDDNGILQNMKQSILNVKSSLSTCQPIDTTNTSFIESIKEIQMVLSEKFHKLPKIVIVMMRRRRRWMYYSRLLV